MIFFIVVSIIYFGVMVFLAEQRAPKEYNKRENTLGELACQTYDNRMIMQWGFKGFGIILFSGVVFFYKESLNEPHYSIPLALYAIFMYLTGIFSAKPFEHLVFYSIKESRLHGIFSQLAGMSLSLLIVMKFFVELGSVNRVINIVSLVFILYISARIGSRSSNKGIYERILYLVSFLWLIYANSVMM